MSEYTLFLNTLVYAYPDDVPDAFFSRWMETFNKQGRYNVKLKRLETIALAAAATRTITPTALALADWLVIIVRIKGTARLNIVAKDTDGTTTINGFIPAYGTADLPGYVVLSTYNITSLQMLGQASGATVEVFVGTSEEDS